MTVQLDSAPPAPPETATPEPVTPGPVVVWPVRDRARRLTGGWLALGMVVAYATCVAIEPLPPGPQPVLPWWYGVIGFASIGVLVTACVAAARNRSWAPAAVIVNGVAMVAETVTCPASGHHHVLGWWWYAQLALSLAVLAAGILARTQRR